MKPLHRLTVAILTCGALVLGMSMLVCGQAENPPAKTKASGKTSGRGQTAVEQTVKGGAKEATLVGCLSGPNTEGAYKLTSDQHKKGVEVHGASGLDLKPHAGHEVKLTGLWVSSTTGVGEQAKSDEKAKKHFNAINMEHIAATCTATTDEKPK